MNPDLTLIADGNKFMWDGTLYETREEAARAEEAYQHDNFEFRMREEADKFLVYTRRVVKQVVITDQ